MDRDLASACFGDAEPPSAQRRLIRSALHRIDAGNVPPGLIEEALAATGQAPERVEEPRAAVVMRAAAAARGRPWLSMAAGLLVIVAAALLAHPLFRDDDRDVASFPASNRSSGGRPNAETASQASQGSSVRQAPFLRATPELKRALRAYLADPAAGRPALEQALGRHAAGVDDVRLDDGLIELLKSNRPFLGVLIDEDGSGLVLRVLEMPR